MTSSPLETAEARLSVAPSMSVWAGGLVFPDGVDMPTDRKAYQAAYRAAHKEEKAAYHAAYYILNREQILASCKRYKAQHREQEAAREKAYCAAHREEIATREKAYRALHCEESKANVARYRRTEKGKRSNKANCQRRYALRRQLVQIAPKAVLTRQQWEKILRLANGQCFWCKTRAKLTQDHVIPLSKGGLHTPQNVVAACQPCNSKKRDKILTLC